MTKPVPFESSLSARLLLVAAAVVTVGGGLIPLLGLNPNLAPPLILVAGGLTALVGIVLGIYDYASHVLMAALLAPFAFWIMTLVVLYASRQPTMGWFLLSLGAIPLSFALAATRRMPRVSARQRAPARA